LKSLGLTSNPSTYKYIGNDAHIAKTHTTDDKLNFKLVTDAMRTANFEPDLIRTIWSLIASIIHLGQINFSARTDMNNNAVSGQNTDSVQIHPTSIGLTNTIASLLELDEDELRTALTSRLIATGSRDVLTKCHTSIEASYARDALAKAMYEKLFTFIFSRINQILDVKGRVSASERTVIGVLDIYGFEVFETNGFEQFCINYCNEKLQQLFIELVLKQEQEEYQRENINWSHIDYFNNKVICDLVEQPHRGMIAIIDDACFSVGHVDDQLLLEHLSRNLKGHKHFASRDTHLADKSLGIKAEFRIRHYAGDVKYNIGNFIDKNKDALYQDFKRLLFNSRNRYACEFY
jgi:myosin-1